MGSGARIRDRRHLEGLTRCSSEEMRQEAWASEIASGSQREAMMKPLVHSHGASTSQWVGAEQTRCQRPGTALAAAPAIVPMFCSSCGQDLKVAGAKFCRSCGKPVRPPVAGAILSQSTTPSSDRNGASPGSNMPGLLSPALRSKLTSNEVRFSKGLVALGTRDFDVISP
jgi:hypothetical protein